MESILAQAQVIGSEDCLYLNVSIPYKIYRTSRNPVMVWIHGGGYLMGSGNDTHQRFDYLMAKDVILVSINYRLGALGKITASKKKLVENSYPISAEDVGIQSIHLILSLLNCYFYRYSLILNDLSRFLKSWSRSSKRKPRFERSSCRAKMDQRKYRGFWWRSK